MFTAFRADSQITLLVDRSKDVFSQCSTYQQHFSLGMPYWTEHIERSALVSDAGHQGLAIGDINDDGLDDVYICQAGALPNRLFLHCHNDTVRDISARSGANFLNLTSSALIVDLNNDGHQDLVVAALTALLILERDGTGSFTQRQLFLDIRHAFSLTAADCDDDGRLDIYACVRNMFDRDPVSSVPSFSPLPYHDAANGAKNFMLRNVADWNFQDVTTQVGLDQENRRWMYAAS